MKIGAKGRPEHFTLSQGIRFMEKTGIDSYEGNGIFTRSVIENGRRACGLLLSGRHQGHAAQLIRPYLAVGTAENCWSPHCPPNSSMTTALSSKPLHGGQAAVIREEVSATKSNAW
jgi:hypothetical protein